MVVRHLEEQPEGTHSDRRAQRLSTRTDLDAAESCCWEAVGDETGKTERV